MRFQAHATSGSAAAPAPQATLVMVPIKLMNNTDEEDGTTRPPISSITNSDGPAI